MGSRVFYERHVEAAPRAKESEGKGKGRANLEEVRRRHKPNSQAAGPLVRGAVINLATATSHGYPTTTTTTVGVGNHIINYET
jgi:hypothetical protein